MTKSITAFITALLVSSGANALDDLKCFVSGTDDRIDVPFLGFVDQDVIRELDSGDMFTMLWSEDSISYVWTHPAGGDMLDINRWTLRFTGKRSILGTVTDVHGHCAFNRQL